MIHIDAPSMLIRIILICNVSRETSKGVVFMQHFVIYIPYHNNVSEIRQGIYIMYIYLLYIKSISIMYI
jgi:hypothetical protein